MGVSGLTTFVKDDPKASKSYKLHDTNLVIDGNALKYHLYGMSNHSKKDAQFAGDYVHFGHVVRKFFNTLNTCKIVPYVIVDGGLDPSEIKLQTTLSRLRNRLSALKRVASGYSDHLLPIHSFRVFSDVLLEMNVKVVRSIFEADGDVAMVGNMLGCPVLSNDSDFYIFDLKGGFIRLDSLDLSVQTGSDKNNSFKYIQCDIFFSSYFMRLNPGLKPHMLPLLSCIMGNDYITTKIFQNVCAIGSSDSSNHNERDKRVKKLLNWLASKSLEEARDIIIQHSSKDDRENTALLVNMSIDIYSRAIQNDPCPLNHLNRVECKSNHAALIPFETPLGDTMIVNFIQFVHSSSMMSIVTSGIMLLDPQSEHFLIASSYSSARKLIIYYCSLLRPTDASDMSVTIYERIDAEIGKDTFQVLNKLADCTSLPWIKSIENITQIGGKELMLKMLNITNEINANVIAKVGELPLDEDTVSLISSFIIVLNYTIAKSEDMVTVESVMALIICLIYYEIIDTFQKNKSIDFLKKKSVKSKFTFMTKKPSSSFVDTRIVHFYSQLQAVLLFFSEINRLLKFPFPEIQVHRFLNGVLYYNLVMELRKNSNPQEVVNSHFCIKSVQEIFNTIFGLVSDKLIRMKETGQKRNTKKVMKQIRRAPVKVVPINKFSLLTIDDE